MKCPS